MTKTDKTSSTGEPDASVEAVKDAGGDEVQASFDAAEEKGFFGEAIDETPRENYTVQGVGSGAETPETNAELRMNQPPRSY